mmetsp:Transcript_50876/g.164636  ORF Transcript_50876/g.164636 Transcript_50876/m.164636 type:complete len:1355 (+) Transcript_50876:174-4238(+)
MSVWQEGDDGVTEAECIEAGNRLWRQCVNPSTGIVAASFRPSGRTMVIPEAAAGDPRLQNAMSVKLGGNGQLLNPLANPWSVELCDESRCQRFPVESLCEETAVALEIALSAPLAICGGCRVAREGPWPTCPPWMDVKSCMAAHCNVQHGPGLTCTSLCSAARAARSFYSFSFLGALTALLIVCGSMRYGWCKHSGTLAAAASLAGATAVPVSLAILSGADVAAALAAGASLQRVTGWVPTVATIEIAAVSLTLILESFLVIGVSKSQRSIKYKRIEGGCRWPWWSAKEVEEEGKESGASAGLKWGKHGIDEEEEEKGEAARGVVAATAARGAGAATAARDLAAELDRVECWQARQCDGTGGSSAAQSGAEGVEKWAQSRASAGLVWGMPVGLKDAGASVWPEPGPLQDGRQQVAAASAGASAAGRLAEPSPTLLGMPASAAAAATVQAGTALEGAEPEGELGMWSGGSRHSSAKDASQTASRGGGAGVGFALAAALRHGLARVAGAPAVPRQRGGIDVVQLIGGVGQPQAHGPAGPGATARAAAELEAALTDLELGREDVGTELPVEGQGQRLAVPGAAIVGSVEEDADLECVVVPDLTRSDLERHRRRIDDGLEVTDLVDLDGSSSAGPEEERLATRTAQRTPSSDVASEPVLLTSAAFPLRTFGRGNSKEGRVVPHSGYAEASSAMAAWEASPVVPASAPPVAPPPPPPPPAGAASSALGIDLASASAAPRALGGAAAAELQVALDDAFVALGVPRDSAEEPGAAGVPASSLPPAPALVPPSAMAEDDAAVGVLASASTAPARLPPSASAGDAKEVGVLDSVPPSVPAQTATASAEDAEAVRVRASAPPSAPPPLPPAPAAAVAVSRVDLTSAADPALMPSAAAATTAAPKTLPGAAAFEHQVALDDAFFALGDPRESIEEVGAVGISASAPPPAPAPVPPSPMAEDDQEVGVPASASTAPARLPPSAAAEDAKAVGVPASVPPAVPAQTAAAEDAEAVGARASAPSSATAPLPPAPAPAAAVSWVDLASASGPAATTAAPKMLPGVAAVKSQAAMDNAFVGLGVPSDGTEDAGDKEAPAVVVASPARSASGKAAQGSLAMALPAAPPAAAPVLGQLLGANASAVALPLTALPGAAPAGRLATELLLTLASPVASEFSTLPSTSVGAAAAAVYVPGAVIREEPGWLEPLPSAMQVAAGKAEVLARFTGPLPGGPLAELGPGRADAQLRPPSTGQSDRPRPRSATRQGADVVVPFAPPGPPASAAAATWAAAASAPAAVPQVGRRSLLGATGASVFGATPASGAAPAQASRPSSTDELAHWAEAPKSGASGPPLGGRSGKPRVMPASVERPG